MKTDTATAQTPEAVTNAAPEMLTAIKYALDELSRKPNPSAMTLMMIQGVLAAAYDKATA